MFSWKRGILHALIPLAAVIALGLLVLAVKDVADHQRFAEGLVRFAAVSCFAGFAISYLFQTGKRVAGWGVIAGIGILFGIVAVALLFVDPRREIDRRALLDDGTTLRHPSLGFTLKRPPAEFKDAPDLAAKMNQQDSHTTTYAYSSEGTTLIVAVLWGTTDIARAAGEIQQAFDLSGVQWREKRIGDDDAHLLAVTQGVTMRVEMHRGEHDIVTLMVTSKDPNALADVISSFQR